MTNMMNSAHKATTVVSRKNYDTTFGVKPRIRKRGNEIEINTYIDTFDDILPYIKECWPMAQQVFGELIEIHLEVLHDEADSDPDNFDLVGWFQFKGSVDEGLNHMDTFWSLIQNINTPTHYNFNIEIYQ